MAAQDGHEQCADPLVLPLVAALEVGKLDLAAGRPVEVLGELVERRLEPHTQLSSKPQPTGDPSPSISKDSMKTLFKVAISRGIEDGDRIVSRAEGTA